MSLTPGGAFLNYGGFVWTFAGMTTAGYVWETVQAIEFDDGQEEVVALRMYAMMIPGGPTGALWPDLRHRKVEVYAYKDKEPLFAAVLT